MASTSETGHAKNVANFENLVSFSVGYGATFNPSKATLKVPALQTQLASCKANIASVTSTSVAFNNAVNARMIAFYGLKKLATRLVNSLDATGATVQTVKDAKTVNAKVQGSKLTKADSGKAPIPIDPNTPVSETTKSISSAQLSYSSLIEHVAKFVTILSTEPAYVPNETDLKVVTLNALVTNLRNTNTGVINAYTTVSNSRLSRDQSLYNTTNGLCESAKEVKMYVKSVYGATSPQYKQISGIAFKTVKQ